MNDMPVSKLPGGLGKGAREEGHKKCLASQVTVPLITAFCILKSRLFSKTFSTTIQHVEWLNQFYLNA
jgi:hypothetical protein